MIIKKLWPLFFLSVCGLAQNDLQANVNLQFRFANPGARAQAMGGAFVGLADDTTAIFANPAGLTQMRSSPLVLEGNQGSRSNNIPFYSGTIEQTGLQDFDFRLNDRDFKNDTTSIPFLGYVNSTSRIKWGLFLAEQGNFERSFDTLGVGIPPYNRIDRYVEATSLAFFPPSDNFSKIQMRTLGFSAATRLGSVMSAGITVNYSQFDYEAGAVFRFPNFEELFPDITFSPRDLAVYRPLYGQEYARVNMVGDDRQLSFNAGFLLTPSERFSFGAAYKRQPGFEYGWVTEGRDGSFEWEDPVSGVSTFNVPDSFGAGISFKPSDVAILSLEVNRILYSELGDDFLAIQDSSEDPRPNRQQASDITEYHVGFEYVFTSTSFPLALRLGYFYEPYHALVNSVLDTQLLFRFLNETGTYRQGDRNSAFLHRFAQDLNHITLGLGLTMGNVIFDFSGDIDEEDSSLSLSSIYRF